MRLQTQSASCYSPTYISENAAGAEVAQNALVATHASRGIRIVCTECEIPSHGVYELDEVIVADIFDGVAHGRQDRMNCVWRSLVGALSFRRQ